MRLNAKMMEKIIIVLTHTHSREPWDVHCDSKQFISSSSICNLFFLSVIGCSNSFTCVFLCECMRVKCMCMRIAHAQIIHQRHYVDKCLTTYSVDFDLKIAFRKSAPFRNKNHTHAHQLQNNAHDIMMALKDAIHDSKTSFEFLRIKESEN